MMNENIFHVIKDPVHGTMQFTTSEDNWIKPFIDSPNFQRLRHIKQLGMGDYIFPGAVHTRFNHSLGCTYIASQIAHKIVLAEEERQLVMIACLLHDIGHGPFSHTFEDLFHKKIIRHEAWTPFFLADYCTNEFFQLYNHRNPRHHFTEEKFLQIKDMIMHHAPTNTLLADIVSSQLDADRLDYLLRDSHFCGVSYGEFDFRWMLNSMAIVKTKKSERLGITYKGIGVVEHYLMARRLMVRNIYHHQKKLALESFLIKLLTSLAETLETFSPFAILKKTRLGKFLTQVNRFNQAIMQTAHPDKIKQEFLEQNYLDYKELYDYDVLALIKWLAECRIDHVASRIAKRLHERRMPKIFRLDNIEINHAENIIKEFRQKHSSAEDWQFALIRTPHKSYSEEDPILVFDESGHVKPLNEMSVMINAMSDKFEHTAFLCIDIALLDDPKITSVIEKLTSCEYNLTLVK